MESRGGWAGGRGGGGAPFGRGDDALKRRGKGVLVAVGAGIVDLERLALAAVEDHIDCLFRQIAKRRIQRETVFFAERFKKHAGLRTGLDIRPAHDIKRVFAQGLGPVRHDQIGIDLHLHAQACAGRAGAEWAVEGEGTRRELLDGDAALRAGQILGEEQFGFAWPDIGDDDAAGE